MSATPIPPRDPSPTVNTGWGRLTVLAIGPILLILVLLWASSSQSSTGRSAAEQTANFNFQNPTLSLTLVATAEIVALLGILMWMAMVFSRLNLSDGSKAEIAGATKSTLSLVTKMEDNGMKFFCKVKDGSGATIESDAAALTVTPLTH